jgi:hypothetical protein
VPVLLYSLIGVPAGRLAGALAADGSRSCLGEWRGETGQNCMASSADASAGVSDRPGRVATARGLLIIQR